jgi:hypothetical protein
MRSLVDATSRAGSTADPSASGWRVVDRLGTMTLPYEIGSTARSIHHKPASMLAVLPGLVRPELNVEIEMVATRPSAR